MFRSAVPIVFLTNKYPFGYGSQHSIIKNFSVLSVTSVANDFDTKPYQERRCTMDAQELKKFLAGIGIAGLLAGTSMMAGGCASTG